MDPSEVSFSPPEAQQEVLSEDDLSSPFLNNVPQQDRAIVGKYIKDWDSLSSKKIQTYAEKLKPYENLGPLEELQKYTNLAKAMQTQEGAEKVFRVMFEGLQTQYGDDFDKELLRILELQFEQEQQEMSEEYDYQQEAPDPDEVFRQNVTQELDDFRQWREQQETDRVNAEQNAQLDSALAEMHTRLGPFDDNWVLMRIAEHGDPNKAVQEFKTMTAQYSTQGTPRQAPKVMGGQGGVPNESIDPSKLRDKDRRELINKMLASTGD